VKIGVKYIDSFKEGDQIQGFFLCKSIENRITRLGDEYLDLILQDSTGDIRAKIWSFVNNFKDMVTEGKPVAVKGKVISFNKVLELNISSINHVNKDIYKKYGYTDSMIVKTIDDDKEKLLKKITQSIELLSGDYKKLLNKLLRDNKTKIKSIPSLDVPYDLNGGFLKQIVSVLNLNKKIFTLYKDLDKELIIAGIIIRNIGLINYFNDDMQYSVSDENENLGSRLIGINLINDYCNRYVKFSQEIKTSLQNIILSENSKNDVNIRYINSIYEFDLNVN